MTETLGTYETSNGDDCPLCGYPLYPLTELGETHEQCSDYENFLANLAARFPDRMTEMVRAQIKEVTL